VGHQRIKRRILDLLRKKETQKPPIKDLLSTIKETPHQIMPVVTAEAHTHLDLRTAYSTVVRPSITQKIAPYSSSPNEKWTKNPTSLHSKWHSKKSTTLCNGLPTTSNICHPTLRMPQPTIHNIRHHQQYSPPKQPSPSPGLLPIISLCHNQPSTTFSNSTNNISSSSATN
jgi:hypothetical protein